MKKFLINLRSWFKSQCEQMKKSSAQRKYAQLVKEAERVIQVKEYAGKVWFSVNGQPLLESDKLTRDFADILASARTTWVSYQLNECQPDTIIPKNNGNDR